MTTQTTSPQSTDTDLEHRAAVVAQVRALADWIEQRTDLPVPTSISAQHSLPSLDPTNEDVVRAAAEALGVEPDIYETAALARYAISTYPLRLDYVVHGFLPTSDDEQSEVAA